MTHKTKIKTIAEALEVIKELQKICKKQRSRIKELEEEREKFVSYCDDMPDFLKSFRRKND